MNPVLILTHNNLELTKKCVESVRKQDVPTYLCVIDNGSTDGTVEWFLSQGVDGGLCKSFVSNEGVSAGWNVGLEICFNVDKADHVLVVNNDTILPPWLYRSLLAYDVPFVTGVSVGEMEAIAAPQPPKELAPCPDFSAWLMRRDCWDKVGRFDERMKHYASDNDYHVRAHRAGVPLMNAGVHFYHERSSTLKLAPPEEHLEICRQADADREVFKSIYGCMPWEPGYAELFK
jgi:GT2 family glycosyltransferase